MVDDQTGLIGKFIAVHGVVQGVGFRPFVYRLAHERGLVGWVLNHSGGVDIEVEGPTASVEGFLRDLAENPPPLARITSIEVRDHMPNGVRLCQSSATFEIRESRAESRCYQRLSNGQAISPDMATCTDCLQELLEPGDRRYRYPFTNCTNCGPRFTLITDIPYDRPNTTMAKFQMCPDCQREYDDPLDRRFHAQPNACPACGPRVWLIPKPTISAKGLNMADGDSAAPDAITETARLLRQGAIVALKGLGGFHLACDATNTVVVARLRERKRRLHKPLAVMMATLEQVRQQCRVSKLEEELLTSRECPIVLLSWREESDVARNVAPGYHHLGTMLPYTPLHHILLQDVGCPLVMTSGNRSEEPICQTNEEAQTRLAHIADAFLLHNRDIHARYDDSVWMVCQIKGHRSQDARGNTPEMGLAQPIRRSRGYAPYPISLPFHTRPTLAVGAELKNTFCLTRDRYGFLSPHIGDMENLETLEHFETSLELLKDLFRIQPEVIAYDLHPEYLSTKFVRAHWPTRTSAPQASADWDNRMALVPIQHHHAHIASCMADNGWRPEDSAVIGVAWDGTGYGTDGHIWGGEWLVADYRSFERMGHLEYLPMPGGEAAIREPWRIALGYLYRIGQHPQRFRHLGSHLSPQEARIIFQQIERGLNCPQTSSAGRLFDAVASLLGVCQQTTYEAQAAIELEQASSDQSDTNYYPWGMDNLGGKRIVRLGPLFKALQRELDQGRAVPKIGARFHRTMAAMIVEMCCHVRKDTGLETVALSGGCFQNRLLLGQTVTGLRKSGFSVLVHHQVPTNDGGLSLGQAAVANAQCKDRYCL